MASKKAVELYKMIAERFRAGGGFHDLVNTAEFVSGEPGKCTFQLTVDNRHLNPGGTLHGGMTATLVDCVSTAAVMSVHAENHPGVSVDMSVTYMRPAREGQSILVDSRVDRIGKTLAFTSTEIKSDDGQLLAMGRHTKAFPSK